MNRPMGRRMQKGPKMEKGQLGFVIKRTWHYLKKYPVNLIIVIISIILSIGFSLIIPKIMKYFIDTHIDTDTFSLNEVIIIVASVAIGTVVIVIFGYFQSFLMAKAASKSTKDIRKDAFTKLSNLPIRYFDTNIHGDIMSKLTNDIDVLSNTISQVIPQLITTIFTLIGAVILMFMTNVILALIILAAIPTTGGLIVFITMKGNKFYMVQQAQIGKLNGIVEENINGLDVVKLYNQEQIVVDKFNLSNEELRKSSFNGQIYTGMMMPAIRIVDNLFYVIIAVVGSLLYIRNPLVMTVGMIQEMTIYSSMSTRPISNLAQVFGNLQMAVAGGSRVFKLIDEKDEYVNTVDEVIEEPKGRVEFKDVKFHYEENDPVLKGINFTAFSGKTIAIVGPTGSGKTTIINLLTRYYDVIEGAIYIDNVNINDISKQFLRSKVGIVLQSTYLFKGTVMDNIRYGRPSATDEEVIEAAKLAQVHDIVERLPRKYHTKVRQGGENFSHGERQLISIARTILYNPLILVLDEATSSVDTRTESKIQKSMEILTKNRTSFVIAHRLQTIKNADYILVLRNGEIIEQGNHNELLANNGLYSEMYKTQFDI